MNAKTKTKSLIYWVIENNKTWLPAAEFDKKSHDDTDRKFILLRIIVVIWNNLETRSCKSDEETKRKDSHMTRRLRNTYMKKKKSNNNTNNYNNQLVEKSRVKTVWQNILTDKTPLSS